MTTLLQLKAAVEAAVADCQARGEPLDKVEVVADGPGQLYEREVEGAEVDREGSRPFFVVRIL